MLLEIVETIEKLGLKDIAGTLAVIAVVVSICFEITPIKFNPISAILGQIGNMLNGPLIKKFEAYEGKLESYEEKIDNMALKIDQNEIDRIRWEILDFANSCRNGRHHTKDEFTHIIDLNEKYHKILETRGMKNGQIDLEYEYIVQVYMHCSENNSFL